MAENQTVQAGTGDCIKSIAFDNGYFWETVWNDASNSDLKQTRKDPTQLLAGDEVSLPPKKTRNEARPDGARHKFIRKATPIKIIFVVKQKGKPVKSSPYILKIDDIMTSGTTGSDGKVTLKIPPNARSGELRVGTGADQIIYPLQLGRMDPIDTITGQKARLKNLGFPTDGDSPEEAGPATQQAIGMFQSANDLPLTQVLDGPTVARLKSLAGC